MEQFKDLGGFIATVLAIIGNPFGITDALISALKGASEGGERGLKAFREGLGKHLSAPLMKFMSAIAVCWGLLLLAAHQVNGSLPGELIAVGAVGIVAIVATGYYVRREGERTPIHAPFIMSAAVLMVASAVMSVFFHLLAFDKGGWLWVIAGVSGLLALAVIGMVGSIMSWFLNGADAIYQLFFEIVVEPAAAAIPVITWENKHEKLAQFRSILRFEAWSALATGIPAFLMLSYIPFFYIVSFSVTVRWAEYFGTIYLLIILSGVGCRMIGRGDVVTKAQERLYLLLFKYAWMAFPVIWAWPYIAGAQVVPVLPLALILLFSVIGIVALYVTLKAIKDWKWHTIALAAAPALFTFYFLVLGFLVYGEVWSGRLPEFAAQPVAAPVIVASPEIATANSFKAAIATRLERFYAAITVTATPPNPDQTVPTEPPSQAPVVPSHASPSPKRLAQADSQRTAQVNADYEQAKRELEE